MTVTASQETSLKLPHERPVISLKSATMVCLSSFLVAVVLVCFTRIYCQSVLQRTLSSVFVETRKFNLTCILPTVSQQILCLKDPGLQNVLDTAKQMATETCKTTFQYDQWECRQPNKTSFQTVTRETAFLQALYTTALTYTVAKACAHGVLASCHCAPGKNNTETSQMLTTGLCPDNTIFGIQFTKSFLHIRKPDPHLYDDTETHNALIGIQVIKNSLEEKCSCYGLLRSCHVKFCYKMLQSFSTIVMSLRHYYYSAVLWQAHNTLRRPKLKRFFSKHLLFTTQSKHNCNTTGRNCLHRSHCTALCCGRGFHTHSQLFYWYCHCIWAPLLSLQCDICSSFRHKYTCK